MPATLTALGLSYLAAWASFRWIENPLRTMPTPAPRKGAGIAIHTIAPPMILGGLIWQLADQNYGPELHIATGRTVSYALGCHGLPPERRPLGICEWNYAEASRSPEVFLVEDSNTAHFPSGLDVASSEEGFDLAVITASACRYLPGVELVRGGQTENPECALWPELVREHLLAAPAGIVILSFSDAYWLGSDWFVP